MRWKRTSATRGVVMMALLVSTAAAIPVRVVDDQGQPVDGATVVVVDVPEKFERFYIFDGTLRPWNASGYPHRQTDAAGRCEIVVSERPTWVVAFHERGWARVRPADSSEIRLAPWATTAERCVAQRPPAAGP